MSTPDGPWRAPFAGMDAEAKVSEAHAQIAQHKAHQGSQLPHRTRRQTALLVLAIIIIIAFFWALLLA